MVPGRFTGILAPLATGSADASGDSANASGACRNLPSPMPPPEFPVTKNRSLPNPAHALALALALALVLVLAACGGSAGSEKVVTVLHAAVTATLVDAGDAGSSPGDSRLFEIATTVEGASTTGRLDAVLLTTGVNIPAAGDEVRIGTLVFSFGEGTDQVVIEGVSAYPGTGSTIAANTSTIRPIVGGSGAYANARGWAESFHNADGTWKHVLHLLP